MGLVAHQLKGLPLLLEHSGCTPVVHLVATDQAHTLARLFLRGPLGLPLGFYMCGFGASTSPISTAKVSREKPSMTGALSCHTLLASSESSESATWPGTFGRAGCCRTASLGFRTSLRLQVMLELVVVATQGVKMKTNLFGVAACSLSALGCKVNFCSPSNRVTKLTPQNRCPDRCGCAWIGPWCTWHFHQGHAFVPEAC